MPIQMQRTSTLLAYSGSRSCAGWRWCIASEWRAPLWTEPRTIDATASGRARLKPAWEASEANRANIERGQFGPGERDPLPIWSRRRMEARLELGRTKVERAAAAQEHLDEMTTADRVVKRLYKAGKIDRLAQIDAEHRRLEAESWLEKERASGS